MIECRAIRIRLHPDAGQALLFRRTGGCARLVRNLALEQRSTFSRPGRPIGYYAQRAELTALKEAVPFLREAPHHCLQEALVDLDTAFANFFAGRAAYPRRHRKRDGASFRFPDPKQFRVEGDTATPDKRRGRKARSVVLHLPKAGAVKAVMHRALPPGARIKSVTVASDGDWWTASLLYEREVGLPEDRSGEAVEGVDLGVCQPVATSSGAVHALPRVTARQQERERRLHRDVARKEKGSKNRGKAVRALARFKAGQARRRRDAREKLTTDLANSHGVIAAEGLDLKTMTASARGTAERPGKNVAQKAGLNRAMLDLGLGTARRRLGQKLAASGGVLLLVPAAHTSQRCNACGHVHPANRPERDRFRCLACGQAADPDVNAARNIRDRALGLWGDPGKIEIGASLALLLERQAKAKRRFRRKAGNGPEDVRPQPVETSAKACPRSRKRPGATPGGGRRKPPEAPPLTAGRKSREAIMADGSMRSVDAMPHVPVFDEWFRGSAAVDDFGAPQILYHGTTAAFDRFDRRRSGWANAHPASHLGFWFGVDPAVVSRYYGAGGLVVPAYLALRNPLRVDAAEAVGWSGWTEARMRSWRAALVDAGHDGVVVLPSRPAFGEYTSPYAAVFRPNQIRSVFAPDRPFDHPALRPDRANREAASHAAPAEPEGLPQPG